MLVSLLQLGNDKLTCQRGSTDTFARLVSSTDWNPNRLYLGIPHTRAAHYLE